MNRHAIRVARGDNRIAFLVALISFVFFWWLWGSWSPQPVGSDESAYVLQARIFASGRLVGKPRPLPVFFWQYHVFVDPILAAKYPPGHAGLLSIGEVIRVPWIIPLLSASTTVALLFVLTARWSSRTVGLVAIALAMTSETSLRFWPSYFSETTTAAVFLIGWSALANYWERGGIRSILLLSVVVGLGAITRPLTMVAFALPALIACLFSMRKHGSWRHLPSAALVTLAVVSLSLLFNARVTGDWRRSPHSEYARRVIPSDRIGFGTRSAAPADSLPAELIAFSARVHAMHAQHTIASLPRTAAARASNSMREMWPYVGFAGFFALLGAFVLPLGVWLIASMTVVAVFTAYLLYAHPASWTLYYLELQAPLAGLTAVGMQVFSRFAGSSLRRSTLLGGGPDLPERAIFAVTALILVVPRLVTVTAYRKAHQEWMAPGESFARAVQGVRPPALIFVRERTELHPERSFVQNVVNLGDADIVLAHDLGARNSNLAATEPDRAAFVAIEQVINGRVHFRVDALTLSTTPK